MSDETERRWTIWKVSYSSSSVRQVSSGVKGPDTLPPGAEESFEGVCAAGVEVMPVAEHEAEITQLEADQLTGAEVAGVEVARAARQLWEAAVEHWYDVDDKGDPIPLAKSLYDNSNAYDGMPIKGQDLYWIGVALGFIEEEESDA